MDVHNQLLDAARTHEISEPAIELLRQHQPLILSAVTAGGKSTTAAQIISQSDYRHVVTHTTRPIRPGEVNGVNYWFVDDNEMLRLLNAGAFIEVQVIHGETVYGISLNAYKEIINKGHKALLIIDVQGIKEIITSLPETKPFFILPPTYEIWMDRLRKRGGMSHVEMSRRLKSAKAEIETVLAEPHFVLIVNNQVETTAQEILGGPQMVNQHKYREMAHSLIDHIKT